MDMGSLQVKDTIVLVSATISSVTVIGSIFVNSHFSKKKERSNRLWEMELERIFALEEKIGVMIENLLAYRCRDDLEKKEYYEHDQYLASAIGRFRRYPAIHKALKKVRIEAAWSFKEDMKHETKEDLAEAKKSLQDAYKDFLDACDAVLERK
ncbi:MAG TPA: hypothetical protein PK002_11820 [Cellvibrio sp.]|nr:hypothetical protein [Cellvibrio sp.]